MNTLYCGYRPFTRYWWRHWFNPKTYTFFIKCRWQRSARGWADCDVWSFDSYLSEVIIGGLTRLKERQTGYPCALTEEQWNAILGEIIAGFQADLRISESPNSYPELGDYTSEKHDLFKQREEADQVVAAKGMKLFSEWYGHFWD